MVEALWRSFCTYCAYFAEGFLVRTFKRLKPLGVLFALIMPIVPKVFWFGPLKVEAPWRSFCTYCAYCAEGFFGSDLEKVEAPWHSFYLLFLAACRCLPKLAIWAA